MRLQKKLVLYVVLIFTVLLGSFYFIFRGSVLSNIQYFEERQAVQHVDSCVKYLNLELVNLAAFLELAQYSINNLSADAMSRQKIEFVAFTSEGVVNGSMLDHEVVKSYPLTQDIKTFISDLGADKRNGVHVLDGKVYIVASTPISHGVMAVGREITRSMMPLEEDGKKVIISPISGGYDYFEGQSQVSVDEIKSDVIQASAALKDIHNKPALKITIDFNRTMHKYAKQKFFYLFIFLLIVSLLFCTGIILLIRKIIYLQQRIFYTSRLASLGTLGTGIAHELNNPLAVVYGYAQNLERLIEEKKIKDPECNEAISKIITYTNRMKVIVEKIGVFSHSVHDSATTKVEDINSIINDSLILIRKELEVNKISLSLKLDGKLPKVSVNPIQMETVLHNIIVNAKEELEATIKKQDKKITVTTSLNERDNFVIIKISDNGRGIPHENVFRVFDPFFTTKSFGKATGLGLSIVHGIIRDLGGKVEIETKENVGTTVILKLPAILDECK